MLTAGSSDPLMEATSNLSLSLLKQLCASALLENASDFVPSNSMPNSSLVSESVRGSALSSFDRPTPAKVWGVGLAFVTVISCCAATGIALMPLLSRRTYRRLLIYFIGLGVGSLSGSAVFHLLPQAWGLVDEEGKSHEYLRQAWMTIAGIYLFFLVDKILKILIEYRKRRKDRRGYSGGLSVRIDFAGGGEGTVTELHSMHQHSTNGDLSTASHEAIIPPRPVHDGLAPTESSCLEPCADGCGAAVKPVESTVDVLREIQRMCSHDHEVHFEKGQSVIATVAWMIIFGDGLHNFIDGLSIGAAFTDSILSGISVSVAVLCEEFPHELGDVAILVSAGMTLRQALLYNLLSAATCYFGFFLGVVVGEFAAATSFIFALAGGMFLYISLGSMAPEMNTTLEKALTISIRQGWLVLLLQTLGVFSGITLMFLISRYGPEIQFG